MRGPFRRCSGRFCGDLSRKTRLKAVSGAKIGGFPQPAGLSRTAKAGKGIK